MTSLIFARPVVSERLKQTNRIALYVSKHLLLYLGILIYYFPKTPNFLETGCCQFQEVMKHETVLSHFLIDLFVV